MAVSMAVSMAVTILITITILSSISIFFSAAARSALPVFAVAAFLGLFFSCSYEHLIVAAAHNDDRLYRYCRPFEVGIPVSRRQIKE
jgi:hypothetical protein